MDSSAEAQLPASISPGGLAVDDSIGLTAITNSWPYGTAGPVHQTVGSCPTGGSYQLHAELGRGASGTVYHATETSTGKGVAIKVVDAYDLENSPELTRDAELAELLQECATGSRPAGCSLPPPPPELLQYYGCWSQAPEGDLWIAMELCEGGPVSELLYSEMALCCAQAEKTVPKGDTGSVTSPLCEARIAQVLRSLLGGLAWMHECKRIHRDVKAANLLLTKTGEVKLCDFGVAAQLKTTMAEHYTVIGTPYWMAPEVITQSGYTTAADIWSVGITAIELAEVYPPLIKDMPWQRAMFHIPGATAPTLQQPHKWSPHFSDFVSACLSKEPSARPSARALLSHPFFQAAASGSSSSRTATAENVELGALLERVRVAEASVPGKRNLSHTGAWRAAGSLPPPAYPPLDPILPAPTPPPPTMTTSSNSSAVFTDSGASSDMMVLSFGEGSVTDDGGKCTMTLHPDLISSPPPPPPPEAASVCDPMMISGVRGIGLGLATPEKLAPPIVVGGDDDSGRGRSSSGVEMCVQGQGLTPPIAN